MATVYALVHLRFILALRFRNALAAVTGKVGRTETLGVSVMEFQGGKDQPNRCNREKKPERNHPRNDDYVGVVDVNVESAWQHAEPKNEGDYGE